MKLYEYWTSMSSNLRKLFVWSVVSLILALPFYVLHSFDGMWYLFDKLVEIIVQGTSLILTLFVAEYMRCLLPENKR